MKITPAIRTQQEIDRIVASISGTWVKRRNARQKLVAWSNELVNADIEAHRANIRRLKAEGAKESELRKHYADITRLQVLLHD